MLTCSAKDSEHKDCRVWTNLTKVTLPTSGAPSGTLKLPDEVTIYLCRNHFVMREQTPIASPTVETKE